MRRAAVPLRLHARARSAGFGARKVHTAGRRRLNGVRGPAGALPGGADSKILLSYSCLHGASGGRPAVSDWRAPWRAPPCFASSAFHENRSVNICIRYQWRAGSARDWRDGSLRKPVEVCGSLRKPAEARLLIDFPWLRVGRAGAGPWPALRPSPGEGRQGGRGVADRPLYRASLLEGLSWPAGGENPFARARSVPFGARITRAHRPARSSLGCSTGTALTRHTRFRVLAI